LQLQAKGTMSGISRVESPDVGSKLSYKKDRLSESPVCSVDRLSPSRRKTDETNAPVLPSQLEISSPEERRGSPGKLMVYEDSDSDSVSNAPFQAIRATARLREGKENNIGTVCTSPLVLQRKLGGKGDRKPFGEVVDQTHGETRSCVVDTADLRDKKNAGDLNRVATEILP
jgi:hypothetical protein